MNTALSTTMKEQTRAMKAMGDL